MFKLKLFFILLFINCFALSAPAIELVESTPVNSLYEQSTIANTEPVWLAMINEAKQSIMIGSFFMDTQPHSSMETIIAALNAAAERGVQVNIILDQSMQQQSLRATRELSAKNITIHYIDFKSVAGGVMHAKYMIVDNHDSFVGSQNFGWKAISQNHELGIRIDNPTLANNLLQLFKLDWQANKVDRPIITNNPVNINGIIVYSAFSPKKIIPKNSAWELPQLLDLIDNAKQQILIQVYQYSDLSGYQGRNRWQAIDKALIAAAQRGVKIKLVVSDAMLKGKAGLRGLQGIQNIPNLEIKISSIPLYQGRKGAYTRVDHSKFMLVDDTLSWIGTSNWQKNYFYNSRDIAIIVSNKNINSQLQTIFWQNWTGKYTKVV